MLVEQFAPDLVEQFAGIGTNATPTGVAAAIAATTPNATGPLADASGP